MKVLSTVFLLLCLGNPLLAATITLTTKNTATLTGVVDERSVYSAMTELMTADIRRKSCASSIYLVINSPGGSIHAGNKLIQYAKTICNLHTVTIYGASMASAIAMQLPGKRYATEISQFMFHRARVAFPNVKEVEKIESSLLQAKKLIAHLESKNACRIGLSLSKYKNLVRDEWRIFGEEAVTLGVADKIVNLKCSAKLQKQRKKIVVATMFGAKTAETSACPLF